jgi:hypothetical protein
MQLSLYVEVSLLGFVDHVTKVGFEFGQIDLRGS